MSTHKKARKKCCQCSHFTEKKNLWTAYVPPRSLMASALPSQGSKPEMSTGMEMQRLSRGAEGASRDVGFNGSPGRDRLLGLGGEELRGGWGGVNSESLGTGKLGKAIPMGPWVWGTRQSQA